MEENRFRLLLNHDKVKRQFVRLACGIDMAKDDFKACFGALDQVGNFVVKSTRTFGNTRAGIRAFLVWLNKNSAKFNPDNQLPFQVLLETTGVYHEAICLALYQAGQPVCLELAKRVKKFLQSIGQYSKNDNLDARGICRMGCERSLTKWQPFSSNLLAIRSALRHRKTLINTRVSMKNQLHAIDHSAYTNKTIERSVRRIIKSLDKEIEAIEQSIKELYLADKDLHDRLQPIITDVKGIGLITALTIVAETNGFAQIKSGKQLTSYAGYDIIENQSGTMVRPSKISKQGNARIRKEMYMAAVTHIRAKQGTIYKLFVRIKERNPKAYKVANVAVQRKLLLLVYTLFKNQEPYDPDYHLTKQKIQISSPEHCSELHEIEQT